MINAIKEQDLVIHKKKVAEVRDWITKQINARVNRSSHSKDKVLVISGPSGSGKTSTVKALCNTLNINICEWDDIQHSCFRYTNFVETGNDSFEISAQFQEFLFQGQRFSFFLVKLLLFFSLN